MTTTLTPERLVFRGARWPGDIAIRGSLIEAVGNVSEVDGDHVIRVDGDIITPGLINAHHHLFQWLTRGRSTTSDLPTWLREMYQVWKHVSVEDVHAAALVGLGEMALSGCTTVFDHHYLVPRGEDGGFDAVVSAARRIGVRLHLARGSMDIGADKGGLAPDDLLEDVDHVLASTERLVREHHDGDRVTIVVGPCSPTSSSRSLLRESAEFARRHGLRLHTHLAETAGEADRCQQLHGTTRLELLEETGWLAGDVWFAHGIHLKRDEMVRMGAVSAGVAHCPSSNARLGSGICPVTELEAAGSPVGLGVDGAASNEVGRLLPELRQSLYFARLREFAHSFSTDDAMRLATVGGAQCIGRPELGGLEPGSPADLAIWGAEDLQDIQDPIAALVLGPDRAVRHLFVGGQCVVRDGALTAPGSERFQPQLVQRAAALWGRRS